MKVVINKCYGGFGLSEVAITRYRNETGLDCNDYLIDRSDKVLVSIVEELGEDSWGGFAELEVIEIPDDVKFQIEEYDGNEWVAEQHRTWS